ncbi:MAG: YceI family protein [Collimonas pratensis]|uniref:YceI family protein n=1 Tax=Collimonas pratensis TaxID=279113 RepID=UPI003C77E2C0
MKNYRFNPLSCGIAAVLLSASVLAVAAGNAATADAKSSVAVVFKQLNVPVEGKFKQVHADIQFDPANLAAARARIDIDVASFDIGAAEYNKEVAGKDWFNAAAYPTASFTSTQIKASGAGYSVAGSLKIKGKSSDVVIPVQYSKQGGAQVFDGVSPIKRLQFDVGSGEWKDTSLVADEVQIKFHLVVPAK